jgi:RNA polymerase sigma factor (sigma-70 family)
VQGGTVTAGRKRAAIELVAREEAELRRTARRFSLCEDDAEDAYQRALEILLVKAPSERSRDLLRWTKTVVKHEALALRRYRERMLGMGFDEVGDPVERLASDNAGPDERTEQRERNARTREALRALKPAELRSLTLLAAGYSYAEIGEMTGYSHTKVNRSLAEGRERFRRLLGSSESGERCEDLLPLLSAFCDGEASAATEAAVREHLRACAACRVTMRSYRTTPAAVAALAPLLPASRSLLERAQELLVGLHSRLPGGGGDGVGVTQVAAAGGSRGAGMAALAKLLAVCAGTVGGAACVATGVAPIPLDVQARQSAEPRVERISRRAIDELESSGPRYETAPPPVEPQPEPKPEPESRHKPEQEPEPEAGEAATPATEAGAVEYAPTAEAAPPPAESSSASGGGNPAGEFGP